MNESAQIVREFQIAAGQGASAALATVVAVEGSSYRRPGARMLILEDGRSWGGVSGGCLERDLIRRARGVLASGRPVLCRYDTDDDDDPAGPSVLGCGGIIEIFLQRVGPDFREPIDALARATGNRQPVAAATVYRATGAWAGRVGELLTDASPDLPDALSRAIRADLPSDGPARTAVARYMESDASADVFLERIEPPQSLVIFGGGPDVVPVVAIAKTLGWHVTVVGSRPATELDERFADADRLFVTPADDPLAGVSLESGAAVVLMTHNVIRDARVLAGLADHPLNYLGILGPRQRTRRLLEPITGTRLAGQARTPVGLDVGAETPQEIALAIVAEVQAVIRSAPAGFMHDRPGPIHRAGGSISQVNSPAQVPARRANLKEVSCPASPR